MEYPSIYMIIFHSFLYVYQRVWKTIHMFETTKQIKHGTTTSPATHLPVVLKTCHLPGFGSRIPTFAPFRSVFGKMWLLEIPTVMARNTSYNQL